MRRTWLLLDSIQALSDQKHCDKHHIPPENFYHDSTGRGTLGTFLSHIWSSATNPVEFGGNPTTRPVSLDIFVYDEKLHGKRLKRCDEHYSKFVTELWWSVRYAVESSQIRNLPETVMDEFSMRLWDKVKGDKYEIESKKVMKERVGRSPDLADWASICVEGARRLGFKISKLAADDEETDTHGWAQELRRKQAESRRKRELTYA